ncbi:MULTISPECIES: hypothetical protein [Amniculibacterium]|uniref:hypothetical protein n=1 Tax=Amniculibacterium TaxID=2715289 RepID=UPI000F5B7D99|nr:MULTISPECIES: hypothetical protein [Amniculibacterium]
MNCLECGELIIGRSDKKFCNDSCRNSYNNKLNSDHTNLMRSIHNKLRNNYRILSSINFVDGKHKTTMGKLRTLGFNFEFITHIKTYKNGAEYRFLYDIGYRYLDDDWVLLVKNEQ